MLNIKQKKWICHLSDTDTVKIIPYDPACEQKFEKIRSKIRKQMGRSFNVVHRGATSLKISGQDEIDVYLPVPPSSFDSTISKLAKLFGKPRSHYHLERARFATEEEGKHIDIFVINNEDESWINGVKFEKYLRTHPKDLKIYEKLKQDGNGLSTREYYKRKIVYINEVLAKAEKKN